MSVFRLVEILRAEVAQQLRRPLFWFMLLIIVLTAFGVSAGNVTVQSGDSSVGGQKAWNTSEFANGRLLSVLGFLLYVFFLAIAAGMTILQDDENKVMELLHTTKLKPGEYVWGKFLAILFTFLLAVTVHLLASIFFNHAIPAGEKAEFRGPLQWSGYVRPALIFVLPMILFFGGAAFFVGERSRRAILVFFLPVLFYLVNVFFLWIWSPSWLPHPINRVLMLVDPAGFRWLNETWLKVDQGVAFYNHESIPLDAAFVVSRVVLILIGLSLVFLTQNSLKLSVRGAERGRARKNTPEAAPAAGSPAAGLLAAFIDAIERPLAALSMRMRAPGFLSGTLEVARVETRGLLVQPGLYLFVPLILVEVIASQLFALGAFDTPLLQTPGTMAVGCMNILTSLLCLLLMFYSVESLRREAAIGLSSIYYATPLRPLSLLLGKAIANTLVAAVILAAALLAAFVVILWQGKVRFDLRPFALVWGLGLLPTFFAWSAFLAAVYSLTRNRYTAYAIGLGVLAFTGYRQFTNQMNWVGNWGLWNSLSWSDMGDLTPNELPLFLNRVLVISTGVLCSVLAVRFFPRRELDAGQIVHRMRPVHLFKRSFGVLVLAALPVATGSVLFVRVENGFQGKANEKAEKDYWRKNVKTWTDAGLPDITAVDVDLALDPERRHLEVKGTFELANRQDQPLRQIPLTAGAHWKNLRWTLNGEEHAPENRSLLYVFAPKEPMHTGSRLSIGFSFDGQFPHGITKNGGGAGEFILPAGVVLTSFSPSFVPVVGYADGIGIDEDNRAEEKEYPDDFYVGQTESAFGPRAPFTTRVRITAPVEYTMNGVGVLAEEKVEGDSRTVTWVSDHPVNFFNVVGAKYSVRKGQGTALYYHEEHAYNIDEMIEALDGARKFYSEWFFPFPWQELKVSEFPGIAGYAQGFPTNISFSESIGFLTRSTRESQAAFMVTAHEAAHQWWGNILGPGKGPGGNILSEGMAHFSTILLMEQVKGAGHRIELCKRFESNYNDRRSADSERPLVKIDGSRDGDTTVTYDKGGWVFWMLLNELGREACLAGMKDFIGRYHQSSDHPVLQDFVAVMREHARDALRFDSFCDQFFFKVVVPEYRFAEVRKVKADAELAGNGESSGTAEPPASVSGDASAAAGESTARAASRKDAVPHVVSGKVRNLGTGTTQLCIAATSGDRFGKDGTPLEDYRQSLTTLSIGAGETREFSIQCDFEPDRVLVDPDALVLQLKRHLAVHQF